MTRLLLTVGLAVLTLAVGLWTAGVCSDNHQRGARLARAQRQLEILRAVHDQLAAEAAAHVWGQAPGRSQATASGDGPPPVEDLTP